MVRKEENSLTKLLKTTDERVGEQNLKEFCHLLIELRLQKH